MDHVEIRSVDDLHAWLAQNHAVAGTQWLVLYKKHTPHYVPLDQVVDELLCWGWVDSVPGKVDEDRSKLRISPRNPKSAWSKVNKDKVARLRAAGRMKPAGEAMIATAQRNGMWDFLNDVDALIAPDDLIAALGADVPGWQAYPRSVQRGALEWIKTAKRADTRAARIGECVAAVRENRRPAPFAR